jgi:hypothetical protein
MSTIESLIHHAVTDMAPSPVEIALDLPAPDVPHTELASRYEMFKRDALGIMYGLADCTASVTMDVHQVRANQCAYLENLSTAQLAVLGVFVRVLGLGYFRVTKATYPKKDIDSIRDHWIVFEDRVLRFGPFFAFAAISGKGDTREWGQSVIRQALIDMEAFESGHGINYASLQSVVWKLFCRKAECDLFHSWDTAKEAVEVEMAGYKV